MSEGKFLTFPHCLMAIPGDEKHKLDIILCHSANRAGTSGRSDEIKRDECKRKARERGFKNYWGSPLQVALLRGSIICGFQFGSLELAEKQFAEGERFINEHQSKFGVSPLVFVSAELFWGCYNEQEPTFREFSTLCGINSIVGLKKRPVLIRRSMILARQLGYKSPAVHKAAIRENQKPLTVQQLRDTLDKLESRDLIARFSCGHSNIYFSTGMSYEELQTAVAQIRKNRTENKIPFRRELERRNRAGAKKEPMKKESGIGAETGTNEKEEPTESRDGTEVGTKERTEAGTNEIKASLIRASLTKAPLTNGETVGACALSPEVKQQWERMNQQLGRKSKLK
jgi:hypothetical protein